MPYGKFKMDDKKKTPPFAKVPGRKTIMPVPKPGNMMKTKPGRKTIQPVKPGLKRGL
jgi:hypothetical protein